MTASLCPRTETQNRFKLDIDHLIAVIEPFATVVEHLPGDDARGEGWDEAGRRLFAVRFGHRDGQGGAR